jgi:hypothetical protein
MDGESTLITLLQPDQYRRLSRDRALESLEQELSRHADAPNPIGSFYFWNRARRELSLGPFCILQRAAAVVYTPYLDREMYDFLSSLPARELLDGSFHDDAIGRAYPRLAAIAYQNKDAGRPDPTHHRAGLFRALVPYVWERCRQPSRWVRNRYVVPRVVYALVNRRYREASLFLSPQLLLYLFQLEALSSGSGQPRLRVRADRRGSGTSAVRRGGECPTGEARTMPHS